MVLDTKYKIRSVLPGGAKKSLGQHFLSSQKVVEKMVAAAEISPADTILEVGPGLGILTKELLASPAKQLIACEKDRRLCVALRQKFKSKRAKIICDDALLLIPSAHICSPFKVVANLPYNISSPTLISLLTVCPTLPEAIVVMLQKEVAERLICPPGSSNRGILTVLIELFGKVKIIERVPRQLFYPPPQVDSAVIKISGISPLPFPARSASSQPEAATSLQVGTADAGGPARSALKIIKFAFAGKRKKIKNSLFSALKIPPLEAQKIAASCGITLDQRPEELNKTQWQKLISALYTKY